MATLENGFVATGTNNGVISVWDGRINHQPCIEIKEAHPTRIRGIDGVPAPGCIATTGSTDGKNCIGDKTGCCSYHHNKIDFFGFRPTNQA